MKKLIKLLQTPYPALCKRWKTVVVPSLIVFLIIYLLQPFGISRMETGKLPVLLGYAVVSSAALGIMVYLLPWLFPAYHKEQNWTVGKELLHTLIVCLLIGLFNWLYTAWVFGLSPDWRLLGISMVWVSEGGYRAECLSEASGTGSCRGRKQGCRCRKFAPGFCRNY